MNKPGTYARFATSEGDFTIRFFEQDAPKTVANFVGLAEGTIDPATGKAGTSKRVLRRPHRSTESSTAS